MEWRARSVLEPDGQGGGEGAGEAQGVCEQLEGDLRHLLPWIALCAASPGWVTSCTKTAGPILLLLLSPQT